MSDVSSGEKFRGVCSKIIEGGLRNEISREGGLAGFTAISIDHFDGQLVGVSVVFPHYTRKSDDVHQA